MNFSEFYPNDTYRNSIFFKRNMIKLWDITTKFSSNLDEVTIAPL